MRKSKNHTPQPIGRNNSTQSRVKQMADMLKGLPKGWRVEIKTRKTGIRVGEKYKCYIAPVTGCKFYSKEEVSRYLKSRPKLGRRSIVMESESHVVIERNDSVEGLPPGWTLDFKVTKKGNKIRSDPYYTDPVTRYQFRSKKGVLRYLQTGELGKYAIKPKGGDVNVKSVDEKTSPPTTAKILKQNDSMIQRSLFTGQSSTSDEAVKDEQILESSMADGIFLSEYASNQCGEKTELSSLGPLEVKSSNKRQGKKVANKRHVSAQLTTIVPSEEQLLQNGVEEHENRKTKIGSRKRKNRKEVDTPRRASKRLAAINAVLASDLETPNQESLVAAVQPSPSETPLVWNNAEVAPDLETFNNTHQVAAVHPPPEAKLAIDSTSDGCIHLVSEQLNQLESEQGNSDSRTHTTRGEEPLEQGGFHVETIEQTIKIGKPSTSHAIRGEEPLKHCGFHFGAGEQPIELEKPSTAHATTGEEPLKQGGYHVETEEQTTELEKPQPFWDQTTPEKVEIETKADEKPEFPLELPFGDSWPDPCLEFAFKTLTGAIPVEDNLAVQDYFQNQLSSTQTHNNGIELPRFDDFCQTDNLFQFDSMVKPASPNQLQKRTTPGSASESVLGFSDNVLQQPNGDGNGPAKGM